MPREFPASDASERQQQQSMSSGKQAGSMSNLHASVKRVWHYEEFVPRSCNGHFNLCILARLPHKRFAVSSLQGDYVIIFAQQDGKLPTYTSQYVLNTEANPNSSQCVPHEQNMYGRMRMQALRLRYSSHAIGLSDVLDEQSDPGPLDRPAFFHLQDVCKLIEHRKDTCSDMVQTSLSSWVLYSPKRRCLELFKVAHVTDTKREPGQTFEYKHAWGLNGTEVDENLTDGHLIYMGSDSEEVGFLDTRRGEVHVYHTSGTLHTVIRAQHPDHKIVVAQYMPSSNQLCIVEVPRIRDDAAKIFDCQIHVLDNFKRQICVSYSVKPGHFSSVYGLLFYEESKQLFVLGEGCDGPGLYMVSFG